MNEINYNNIINRLINSEDDVWFIRAERSNAVHISINDETACHNVARNVYYISQKPPAYNNSPQRFIDSIVLQDKDLYICHRCLWCLYLSQYNVDRKYVVLWRCNFTTCLKKRCIKNSKSPYNTFCTQHKKLIIKRLNTYFSNDVSNFIIKLL